VPLSFDNLAASAEASAQNLGVESGDNWLCVLPLSHVGGLSILTRSVQYGTCVTLLPRFDPAAVYDALRETDDVPVTLISLVPTMLRRMLDECPDWDARSTPRLRAILLGGAPADVPLLDEAARRGLPVVTSYGMTESCSQIAALRLTDGADKRGSAGRPLPGARIEIRDSDGAPCPPSIAGEIWISGPMVATRYLEEDGIIKNYELRIKNFGDPSPAEIVNCQLSIVNSVDEPSTINQQPSTYPWFQTGDIGSIDPDGYLWIDARREDLIITGGENVRPGEVEAALLAHPLVAETCVVSVPDAEWGQVVAAMVVLRTDAPGSSDIIEILEAHCRARLAGYKIPRVWRIVAALPRINGMKVDRGAVQKQLRIKN
jgi:O-succinylbenzoic acid--CoA ligase